MPRSTIPCFAAVKNLGYSSCFASPLMQKNDALTTAWTFNETGSYYVREQVMTCGPGGYFALEHSVGTLKATPQSGSASCTLAVAPQAAGQSCTGNIGATFGKTSGALLLGIQRVEATNTHRILVHVSSAQDSPHFAATQ